MELEKLVEHYYKVSGSSLSTQVVEKEVAWLTSNGWSAESIFFAINYAHKYHREELELSLKNCLDENSRAMLRYYSLAKTKQEIKHFEEERVEYDSINKPKGDNKPSWFRKGIDFDLFK